MSKLVEAKVKLQKIVDAELPDCIPGHINGSQAAELLAHIERLEANQIPEGCVAVPREPTYEMMRAGCPIEGSCERSGECHGDCHCNSTLRDIYRAMIDAAGGTGEEQEDV